MINLSVLNALDDKLGSFTSFSETFNCISRSTSAVCSVVIALLVQSNDKGVIYEGRIKTHVSVQLWSLALDANGLLDLSPAVHSLLINDFQVDAVIWSDLSVSWPGSLSFH